MHPNPHPITPAAIGRGSHHTPGPTTHDSCMSFQRFFVRQIWCQFIWSTPLAVIDTEDYSIGSAPTPT